MDTVSRPADVKSPSGNVLNPAVLADTLVKNAPSQVMSSVSRISSVPAARSISVVTITAVSYTHLIGAGFVRAALQGRKFIICHVEEKTLFFYKNIDFLQRIWVLTE